MITPHQFRLLHYPNTIELRPVAAADGSRLPNELAGVLDQFLTLRVNRGQVTAAKKDIYMEWHIEPESPGSDTPRHFLAAYVGGAELAGYVELGEKQVPDYARAFGVQGKDYGYSPMLAVRPELMGLHVGFALGYGALKTLEVSGHTDIGFRATRDAMVSPSLYDPVRDALQVVKQDIPPTMEPAPGAEPLLIRDEYVLSIAQGIALFQQRHPWLGNGNMKPAE